MAEQVPDWEDVLADRKREQDRTNMGGRAFEDVTRVVIIADNTYTEYWADSWKISVQDGGKTVKLLTQGDGASAVESRNQALGEMLGMSSDAAGVFTQAVADQEGQPDRFQ
ncbi:hypothetical protein [Mycobacteroides abscessus]|uniref:hypothetical protein n=1 Tax=Mycobacteroides abscessus TaxID=36809 RepID=UPI0002681A42|nr:hypothetical protein [Mycobacteroides abscessus]EIU51775.1 hypothetical protein MA6G0125S_5511 [Mycobacteroides abscessus 6G-0125-S]EIU64105.1 hypothetical protein MA6G0728S_5222 [Mycobacteroides abscessus 6G-0728-S]EIU74862.1 hypothetical protein MA6G1108_5510 [Mycobacteroides abscessus 6G-1108]EIV02975.1 hypothetical protein MA6G0728R_5255 [Mycobacteroides abscessus 6G-0728-R]